MFAVNDSGSSMHLVDRDGRVILTLKSKFFSAHNKWYIYSGRGTDKENKIATVKPQSGTTSAEVSLHVIMRMLNTQLFPLSFAYSYAIQLVDGAHTNFAASVSLGAYTSCTLGCGVHTNL